MHTLDKIREEYVYTIFMYHKYLVLDWDRRTGKSNYSVTCILDYALSHPNSKNLVMGYNQDSSENLQTKMITCNNLTKFQSTLTKNTKNKMEFVNGSVIYFNKIEDDIKYNTILIDEVESFNLKYRGLEYFLKRLFQIMNPSTMILANCTDYEKDSLRDFRESFKNKNIPIVVDHYKTTEQLLPYLRKKKINKIKENI
jgi:hypothetical protein